MADDLGFVALLEWAFNQDPVSFPEGPIRNNARDAAVSIWLNLFSDADRVEFRAEITSASDARALYNEAQVYLDNQEPNGAQAAWDFTFAPILIKVKEDSTSSLDTTIRNLDEAEVTSLEAYRRVLAAYIVASQAYERALAKLMLDFTAQFAQDVFDNPIVAEWQAVVAVVGDGTTSTTRLDRQRWIERVCAYQQFRSRVNRLNHTWVPAVNLGQGIGKANDDLTIWIWLAFDSSGRVVDRSVEKHERVGLAQWNNPLHWQQVPGEAPPGMPMEKHLQNKCWQQDNTAFVRHREHDLDVVNYWIKFRTDYCPYGDLWQLWRSYTAQQRPIPEPLLWMVFQKLVEQCLILQKGTKDGGAGVTGWQQIVHKDIKPENIFLDAPNNTNWSRYPTPKMADFGHALQTSLGDPSNPWQYTCGGTPTYIAPEQFSPVITRYAADGTPSIFPLMSHTNVWGIGMVMLQLTIGTQPPGGRRLPPQKPNTLVLVDGQWIVRGHRTTNYARKNHSRELLDLIERAIVPYPDERPTAQDLHDWITGTDYGMSTVPDTGVTAGVAAYCAAAAAGNQPEGGDFEWQKGREQYALAFAAPPVQAPAPLLPPPPPGGPGSVSLGGLTQAMGGLTTTTGPAPASTT